jgi:hypothetical protein
VVVERRVVDAAKNNGKNNSHKENVPKLMTISQKEEQEKERRKRIRNKGEHTHSPCPHSRLVQNKHPHMVHTLMFKHTHKHMVHKHHHRDTYIRTYMVAKADRNNTHVYPLST